MDKILEVKDLKVSFRTQAGTLKAVRDISFDLERGKTLAIVGESGSGKSVTAKAIQGILAGNTIIEGGEIFFDGKDLLKISEEEFHHIRGDKVAMIFQDPLSSLNPIVKIGKQITEATLLKSKLNRREAKSEFKSLLSELKDNMVEAHDPSQKDRINDMVKTFDKFAIESNHLENNYNNAFTNAMDLDSLVEDFLFLASKNQKLDVKVQLKDFRNRLGKLKNKFLTGKLEGRINEISKELENVRDAYKPKENNMEPVLVTVNKLEDLLNEIVEMKKPDFMNIGYYKLYCPDANLDLPVDELDEVAGKYADEHFMNEFFEAAKKGVENSYNKALENKKAILPELEKAREFFGNEFEKSAGKKYAKELSEKVDGTIDKLEFIKDSTAYTFRSAVSNGVDKLFYYIKRNPKEEARFARQSAKRDRMIARGKTVTWKVVPKVVYEPEDLRGNIVQVVDRLNEHYEDYIEAPVDFDKRTEDLVDHFKEEASLAVYRVTKGMAKEKAIKLMKEVGIHEPRLRYNQYPFEFSGGMRQRIVIAIALAANPEILICDEPTTALDVTIQSQILELINKLKEERNLSIIFITHDLGVVANMADYIAVMYAGKIVEYGTADDIFYDPRHPYTWALLSSMPDLDTKEKLDAIPGTPPNMIYPPEGDAFAARNKYAMKIDFEEQPPFFQISETHRAATWLLHPDAPKVETPKTITDRINRMNAKRMGGEQNA
jgi:oligopeptide/dipeptide ABC transporter ATP-binding protein